MSGSPDLDNLAQSGDKRGGDLRGLVPGQLIEVEPAHPIGLKQSRLFRSLDELSPLTLERRSQPGDIRAMLTVTTFVVERREA